MGQRSNNFGSSATNMMSSSNSRAPLQAICDRFGIHHPTLTICIAQFGNALINIVFLFYYVKVFLNRYKINETWFQVTQVLFMVWNAINDPLFGMCQDFGASWARSRRKAFYYGGPFYVLAFLMFWFPWGGPDSPPYVVGFHLLTALFLYDGLFSFIMLSWCAMFAEITVEPAGRVRALKYLQISILLGVNSVAIVEKWSLSLKDFVAFQNVTIVLGLVAGLCFYYTGRYAPDHPAQLRSGSMKHLEAALTSSGKGHREDKKEDESFLVSASSSASSLEKGDMGTAENLESWADAWRVCKQVIYQDDFQRITAMNFVHTFRTTCHLNFAAIIVEGLIPRSILPLGSAWISLFYGACAVIPQILVIAFAFLLLKYGSYRMMMLSFIVSIVGGLSTYVTAFGSSYAILGFMLLDSICVHSFSPLFNILFADYVDDDMVRYKRKSPMSSVVFSMNALFTKPAQSLAPMVVVWLLNWHHYEDYTDKKLDPSSMELKELQGAMFSVMCLTPVLCGAVQVLVFRGYTLRDRHLVKDNLDKMEVM